MGDKGTLTVISGFSGVGKGSVMRSLMSRYEGYALSVSATTRDPRPGESHGVEYYFMPREDFEGLIRDDGLVEYAEYCGNYYGTPRAFLEERLAKGLNVLLEIEIQGAMKVRNLFPDATLVFVMPPDAQTLVDRLAKRGTEEKDVIARRISRAVQESEGIEDYDYILVNDQVDKCADELHQIIRAGEKRTKCNREFIGRIRDGIRELAAVHSQPSSTAAGAKEAGGEPAVDRTGHQ